MSLMVTSFAITATLCYAIYHLIMWHWKRRYLYRIASKFEGPSALPFMGNAHLFIGNSEHVLTKINDLVTSYPSPLRVWLGPVLVFGTTDPEHIKVICNNPKTLGKSDLQAVFARPWLGTGILTAPIPKWKVHRKLIQPTFNAKILNSFVSIFSSQSKILTEQMEPNLGGLEFEVFDLVSRCTLDMICETGMGVKMEAQTNRNCYYVKAAHEVFARFCKRIFSPWLYLDVIFDHTKVGRDQKKYIKYLHAFTTNDKNIDEWNPDSKRLIFPFQMRTIKIHFPCTCYEKFILLSQVIEVKKKQLLNHHSQPGTTHDEGDACELTSKRAGFLDHLMTLPSASLSDKELREEVDTMVVAGNDTSAITSSYVMLMFATHPAVQEKVYQELFDIYGEDDIEERPITPKDLPRMKYLERVIKETLRLFPVAPVIIREVTDDLEIGEQTLPKGSSVVVGIMSLHRNEKYWPDPLKFDPDRFLPEEIAKRHPYAYMAFSAGPRNCIGYNYALMSVKTLLGTVLRRFVLKKDNAVPVKDIRSAMEILLKPVDPIKIRIERRSGH